VSDKMYIKLQEAEDRGDQFEHENKRLREALKGKKTEAIVSAIMKLENTLFIPTFNRYISFDAIIEYFEGYPEAFEYREDV